MPFFPTAATTPTPALVVARMIGTVNINDGINSWSDHPDESSVVKNLYEQRVLANGQIVRTRYDQIACVITVNGRWFDGQGNKWFQFRDSLTNVNRVAVDLGHNVKYALADVVDIHGTFSGFTGRDNTTGETLECWAWSLKLQTYSAVRAP